MADDMKTFLTGILLLFVLMIYSILHPILCFKWFLTIPFKPKLVLNYKIIHDYFYNENKNYGNKEINPKELCKQYLNENNIKSFIIVEVPLSCFETRYDLTYKIY